jgi:DnaJ-class molecular chaperone
MSTPDSERTGGFLRKHCDECHGTGELRIDSENINENFEVETQTVITTCARCNGLGSLDGSDEASAKI